MEDINKIESSLDNLIPDRKILEKEHFPVGFFDSLEKEILKETINIGHQKLSRPSMIRFSYSQLAAVILAIIVVGGAIFLRGNYYSEGMDSFSSLNEEELIFALSEEGVDEEMIMDVFGDQIESNSDWIDEVDNSEILDYIDGVPLEEIDFLEL